MARHAYPSLDNLSPRLAEELRKRIAPDRGNVWKMLMWSPGMAEPFIDFNDAVRYKISLSDSLRELIILRVGHLCEAAYEIHHHTRISREIGMSEELIAAPKVGASAPGLDATQRLALSLTDDLVRSVGPATSIWLRRSRCSAKAVSTRSSCWSAATCLLVCCCVPGALTLSSPRREPRRRYQLRYSADRTAGSTWRSAAGRCSRSELRGGLAFRLRAHRRRPDEPGRRIPMGRLGPCCHSAGRPSSGQISQSELSK